MLELYHFGFSTCSQKVRLGLAEKGLAFDSHEVNLMTGEQHRPDYVKLNPSHVVPTLVHDGQVVIESTLILHYLDDAFPESALRRPDPRGRYEDGLWMKRFDAKVHPAAPGVTFAVGPRNLLLQQPEEVREANIAAIPDPEARAERRSVIEHGVHAPEFARDFAVFLDLLDAMEAELAGRPWLSGETPGLADVTAAPYVLRLSHLSMDPLIEARPGVARWLAAWQARPTWATAVTAWAPEPAVAMLRSHGAEVWPEVERLAGARGA
ncbi:MAG TPA: glutathione S-transferase family protein [Myxococcota bacterium]|nr:glutathione S-transferase family protein [Myxococcota bacterium]